MNTASPVLATIDRKHAAAFGPRRQDPVFSFIVPSTDDESVLAPAYETIRKAVDSIQDQRPWEIIFVDHGTSELAWITINRLMREDQDHVRAFIFTHNQDRSAALALGYREARGNLVFTVELDLHDDPREIPHFLERIPWESSAPQGTGSDTENQWKNILPRGILRTSAHASQVAA